jgi:hypothetical protein
LCVIPVKLRQKKLPVGDLIIPLSTGRIRPIANMTQNKVSY